MSATCYLRITPLHQPPGFQLPQPRSANGIKTWNATQRGKAPTVKVAWRGILNGNKPFGWVLPSPAACAQEETDVRQFSPESTLQQTP